MIDPKRINQDPSVLRMSAPLIVSFVMRSVFTFVDTIYAAYEGDAAVAAIGLTFPFEFVMIAFWIGLSTGLTSALSRAMGAATPVRVSCQAQTASPSRRSQAGLNSSVAAETRRAVAAQEAPPLLLCRKEIFLLPLRRSTQVSKASFPLT